MSESGSVEEGRAARDAARRVPRGPRAEPLALGFGALVVLTFGLIVLGSLVRAHGAELACPDWPLCFGELVPQIDLQVGFEWSHRLAAASVSLLFAGLAGAALRVRPAFPATRRLLALAAGLLLQLVLGGLVSSRFAGLACPEWPTCGGGVWLHTGMATAIALCVAWALRAAWRRPPDVVGARAAVLHPG